MVGTGMSALLSHWRRRPVQLAMLLLGLSLATALWSAVQAINGEARASYDRAAAILGQDRLAQLMREDGARMDQQVFVTLRRAGWLVSPVIDGDMRFGGVRLRIFGIDPLTLPPQAQQVDMAAGGGLLPFITAPGALYAAPETAAQLAGQATPPVRVAEELPPGTVITDIGQAQALLGAKDEISRLLLWPDQPMGRAPLKLVAPGLTLREPSETGDLARLTDSFHLNLTAFGFLAFAVGLFIVHSAIGLAFEQRRSVFRTLRALGLPVRVLTLLLITELLIFALVAGLMGVALGYLVASALLPDVAATLRGLYGADVPGTLAIRPAVWAAGLAIAVIGTLAAAAQGLWRVWHLPLLAPAQPRAWARASERALLWQGVAAMVLLLTAGGIALFCSGLVAGFALLGAMLLGAALALPLVLTGLLHLGGRLARGPLAEWFWADIRQQLPGLSLALMALLLALAANVGVGTMVSSFRLTFMGWLDQRLASELYVAARTEAEATAIHDWLAPRSDAVLPISSIEGRVAGQPAEIYGVADHATYRDNWPLLSAVPQVWDRIATGEGALINEQLSRRKGLGLRDQITLPGGWRASIVGVYSDYGNPMGQVIIGIDTLAQHYPDVSRLRYAIRVAPGKAEALAAALRIEFGLPRQNVIDQAGIKAFSLKVFERTFNVTAALSVLTLGVAGLAMFAGLMTLSGMRRPQLAPVWAMGLTHRQLAWLELWRGLLLAALTMLAALPVGIGLAFVLLAEVNVEAFGWRLPMHLFPGDWVRLGALALLAAGLAAAVPAWRLARISPADLLKVFANER
ncbi:FtsX-like permease family protein [Mesorhizobium sp. L-8-3]|uniref:FtsX-like permease family protein n=1 Tax=Mesorhizobium sp. L-8-3 TaxID=2744522 RepID=UPI001927DB8C